MNLDRFILNRNNLDTNMSNYWLKNLTVEEQHNKYLKNTPLTKQDVNYTRKLSRQKQINNVLGINESNSRILPYNVNSKPKFTRIEQCISKQWPVYARSKAVYKPQFAVLDLPHIRKDIRLNVIHWATNNVIGAALSKKIYLWDATTATMAQIIKCTHEIESLKLDIEGSTMAFSASDARSEIQIWNIKKSKMCSIFRAWKCTTHTCCITAIEYHPSNKYIIMGCEKGNLHIITTTLQFVNFFVNAHITDIIKIRCSPDGRYVATSGCDGFVKIWLFPELKLILSHLGTYCCKGISWHPWHTSYLCCGSTGGSLSLLNTALAKCVHQTTDKSSTIYDLTFNKFTAELAVSHTIFDHLLPIKSQINILANFNQVVDRFEGHKGRILYLEWNPTNEVLASVGSDETIHFWNFFDKNHKHSLQKKHVPLNSHNNLEITIR